MAEPQEPAARFRLGCPVWACEAWVGSLYSTRNRRRWLGEYSRVFGTVEGNSTFYATPADDLVRRWADEAAPGFRFALKTPAAITHEKQLAGAERETAEWLLRLRVLRAADRLGPTLLQLPPLFDGGRLDTLAAYLAAWPDDLPLAVEPRHADYFDGGSVENALDALLRSVGADRALFDSRALFHAPPDDPIEAASQDRKPRPPRRLTVTGRRPFLRFVGRNDLAKAQPWIDEWAAVIAAWIEGGYEPYVFCHAPNDALAPAFAERLHAAIQNHAAEIASLPEWPGRSAAKQQSLF
ncbi:DUF72 domain-containing protein [Botrimarina sp.]|uniref:DUF72 domain-containing protein n=1 Tax=Botrimarina sp. TaxID=2795802 RepID=UPI0032EADAD5